MLMAVAEAGPVDVPLCVTILVLKRNKNSLPWGTPAALQIQSKRTGSEGREAQKSPAEWGGKPIWPHYKEMG